MQRAPLAARTLTYALLIVLPLTSLVCSTVSQLTTGSGTPDVLAPTQPIRPTAPADWVVSKDPSGKCQVSAPPEWQLGTDFFLAAEAADPGPFASAPGSYPPSGLALWGIGTGTPIPAGHQVQIRQSLVLGDVVCSAWRVRSDGDFTDAERAELAQVGATLQGVP